MNNLINKKRLVKTFMQLARIASPSYHEEKVMEYLEKEFRRLKLKTRYAGKPRQGRVGNLIVDVPGRGVRKPRVFLNAHVDTVAPGKNIKPVIRKGVIYSAGKTILGADDKACVAAILEIIRILRKGKIKHPPIRVIFTVAEEIGLWGAKALPKRFLEPVDFGIAMDGGYAEEIIYKAPSQFNVNAVVLGRASHAGVHPERGINAIKIASVAIAKMRIGRIDKETTANIGVIQGGKATNIIPDRVEMKGEARSRNFGKLERQVKHMQDVLQKTCRRFGARVRIKTKLVYHSFEVKQNAKIIKAALSAVKKAGLKPILKETGGGSDANIFNADGVPTIIMGVGAHRVHTHAEMVAIKDMIRGTEVILYLLEELANEKA